MNYFDFYTYINKQKNKHQKNKHQKNQNNNNISVKNQQHQHKTLKNKHVPHQPNNTVDMIVQNKIYKQLHEIVQQKTQQHIKSFNQFQFINKVSSVSSISSLFNVNNNILESYQSQVIHELNIIYTQTNCNELLRFMILRGYSIPFNITLEINPYNPNQSILTIKDGSVSVFDVIYKNEHILKKYMQYLQDIFDITFGSNEYVHQLDNHMIQFNNDFKGTPNQMFHIHDIIQIEQFIASTHLNANDRYESNKHIQLYNVQQIKTHLGIDLSLIYQLTHEQQQLPVLLQNYSGIKKIMNKFTNSFHLHQWKTYFAFQVINTYSVCSSKVFNLGLNFYTTYLNNQMPPLLTTYIACKFIPYTLNKYYYEQYKNIPEIIFCKKIVNQLIRKFIDRIQNNFWLHPKTKQECIFKLTNMKVIIGKDTNIDTSLDVNKKNIITNVLDKYDKQYQYISTHIGKKQQHNTNMVSYIVNAYYNIHTNTIFIPNAILQPPFVNLTKSMTYNLACLGTIIGHEISHCFDEDGILYNTQNIYNKHSWFQPNDFTQYTLLQKNIGHYLEHIIQNDTTTNQNQNQNQNQHEKINTKLYLSETFSDITGFLLAESILYDYLITHNLDVNTHLPKFYVYYTKIWINSQTIQQSNQLRYGDCHIYEKYRVNCVLMSSNYYRQIYNLDKVYENIF